MCGYLPSYTLHGAAYLPSYRLHGAAYLPSHTLEGEECWEICVIYWPDEQI